jgi:hypothetical protein
MDQFPSLASLGTDAGSSPPERRRASNRAMENKGDFSVKAEDTDSRSQKRNLGISIISGGQIPAIRSAAISPFLSVKPNRPVFSCGL